MNDTPVHYTMRELRRVTATPALWISLAGVSAVLGLVGPFGTYEELPVPQRIAYWSAIVFATYFTSFAAVCVLDARFFSERPGPAGYAVLGAASGLPVTIVVWLVNRIVFEGGGVAFVPLLVYVVAIAAVISGLIALFSARTKESAPDEKPVSEPPPILMRLPLPLRGRLIRLSMQDHYVEVTTDKGSHLVLMRMSDAIAETKGVHGFRIHRSHWVAADAVEGTVRRNGRQILRLRDGAELPVSRNHAETVKRAGFS